MSSQRSWPLNSTAWHRTDSLGANAGRRRRQCQTSWRRLGRKDGVGRSGPLSARIGLGEGGARTALVPSRRTACSTRRHWRQAMCSFSRRRAPASRTSTSASSSRTPPGSRTAPGVADVRGPAWRTLWRPLVAVRGHGACEVKAADLRGCALPGCRPDPMSGFREVRPSEGHAPPCPRGRRVGGGRPALIRCTHSTG
jgi:hypothetical protein